MSPQWDDIVAGVYKLTSFCTLLVGIFGVDILLDLSILFRNSLWAARIKFWVFYSVWASADIVLWIGQIKTEDLGWWMLRWLKLDGLDYTKTITPEEVTLARAAFVANFKAEEVLAAAETKSAGLSSWIANIWSNTWVHLAVTGWVLHVLIKDLKGEPRTWWGGSLKVVADDIEKSTKESTVKMDKD